MTTFSGGCQCGAIRFRVSGDIKDSSICHCRMIAFPLIWAGLFLYSWSMLKGSRGR